MKEESKRLRFTFEDAGELNALRDGQIDYETGTNLVAVQLLKENTEEIRAKEREKKLSLKRKREEKKKTPKPKKRSKTPLPSAVTVTVVYNK